MPTKKNTFDVLSIGDCVVDTYVEIDQAHLTYGKTSHRPEKLCLNYAEKIAITNSCQDIGGNAANVASGIAKLGLRCGIVSQIGDDINGNYVAYRLQESGVDTTYLRQEKKRETRYGVVLNYKAERTILSYYPERKYKLPKLAPTQWIYYTSHGQNCSNIQKGVISYLRKHKHSNLAFNPGSHMLKDNMSLVHEVLPYVNLLICNKEEAQAMLKSKGDIPLLLKKFEKLGIAQVAITDGTKGSFLRSSGQSFFMKPFPIQAFAKTGAGDAFASGLLAAIIYQKPPQEALCWATANAGGVIQKFGAQNGLLSRAGISSLLKKYPSILPQPLR
ncbi:carbohydrate kinase family protein [Candidatus Nomurabacteria bacterium]|nr:carbohydrate kinase family protein [Candidatus Nomurabacteria bacterium]